MQKILYPEIICCTMCKKELAWDSLTKSQKDCFHRRGRVYCSTDCSQEYSRRISSETMAATNRKYASERMKKNNPMKSDAARLKMSDTLRNIGHRPPEIKGNGRGLTVPQSMLIDALEAYSPIPEYAVGTKGYPKSFGCADGYKIDIAISELRLAIEVDGGSHRALERKAEDMKKTTFLESQGWTVLRFWNEEILEDLNHCVLTAVSTISKLKTTTTISQTAI